MAKKEQFVSLKFKELRLVLDPQTKKEVQGSLVASSLYGKFPTGFTAEFKNGLFETADEAVIAALHEHPMYGAMFVSASEKGAAKIGQEAALMINTKKEVVNGLSVPCPKCGKTFQTDKGLEIHMRSHAE